MTYEPKLGSRELFPYLEARVYVNHASISPPSVAVIEAARALLDDYAREGFGAFARYFVGRHSLREKLARFLGGRPEEIAFVPSTTQGIADIALCFPWRRGDRIVVFEGEFPTNVTPWQRAAELFELEVKMLSAGEYRVDEDAALERLSRELERGVRLVAVSAVGFQTGHRMPLEEMSTLCHGAGAQLAVDAIQALGVVPLDVEALGIDVLVGGSHKWMMALEGVGFLYARAELASELRPHAAGWLSHEDGRTFLTHGAGHLRYDRKIRSGIDFLEKGSLSATGLAALEASLDLLVALSPERILEHVSGYHGRLEPQLEALGFESARSKRVERRSGTLSVRPPEGVDALALQRQLAGDGIVCSAPDGYLRFSPHWPNAVAEVELVVESIERSLVAST